MYFALPIPMIMLPISPVMTVPSYNFRNPHCMGSNSRCTHYGCQQSKEDDVPSDDMNEEDDLSSEDMDEEIDENDMKQEMIDENDIKIVEIHEGVDFNESQ